MKQQIAFSFKQCMTEEDFINSTAKKHFGIPYVFPYQRLAISNILDCAAAPEENNPAQIVILPTGAGKSLCFMLPALVTDGITLIIFPLLSLMADQQRRLEEAGISSLILRGGMSAEEKKSAFGKIENGEVKIVIANPEILQTPGVLEKVKKGNIFHVVIDEAHTVSQWGDSFREAYLGIGCIVKELSPKVTTAFTATASARILSRFREIIFSDTNPNIIRADPDRPNIRYDVVRYLSKEATLLEEAEKGEKPMIIFCSSRDGTEITARKLKQKMRGREIYFYHAGLSREEKKRTEELFFRSSDGILVATCAYGMGVDKSNIRTVIHADIPSSAEAYLQESGRGGRDRKQAYAVALVPWFSRHRKDNAPDPRQNELQEIFEGKVCRRKALLHILEAENQLCSGCDVCDKKEMLPAGFREITELIKRNSRRITLHEACAILKGAGTPEDISEDFHRSGSWKALSSWKEKEIREAILMIADAGSIRIKKNLLFRKKLIFVR